MGLEFARTVVVKMASCVRLSSNEVHLGSKWICSSIFTIWHALGVEMFVSVFEDFLFSFN